MLNLLKKIKKKKEGFILRNATLDLLQEVTPHCCFGFLVAHQPYLMTAFQLHFCSREKENEERLARAAAGNPPAPDRFQLPS